MANITNVAYYSEKKYPYWDIKQTKITKLNISVVDGDVQIFLY